MNLDKVWHRPKTICNVFSCLLLEYPFFDFCEFFCAFFERKCSTNHYVYFKNQLLLRKLNEITERKHVGKLNVLFKIYSDITWLCHLFADIWVTLNRYLIEITIIYQIFVKIKMMMLSKIDNCDPLPILSHSKNKKDMIINWSIPTDDWKPKLHDAKKKKLTTPNKKLKSWQKPP